MYFKISDNVTFNSSNKNLVHLTGYWEPSTELNNDDLGLAADELIELAEEEEEEDDDETAQKLKLA